MDSELEKEIRKFIEEMREFKGKVEAKLEQIHNPSDCQLVKELNNELQRMKGGWHAFKIIIGILQFLWAGILTFIGIRR
ncbi:MAG: hypothetical protein QW156_05055 [Candidatus Aenigmatarchaeota archaeon]